MLNEWVFMGSFSLVRLECRVWCRCRRVLGGWLGVSSRMLFF